MSLAMGGGESRLASTESGAWAIPGAFALRLSQRPTQSQLSIYREHVCGCNRVLDREIDSDASSRRHCVGSIADAKQTFPAPLTQTIDLDRKQFDFRPVVQFSDAIFKKWRKRDNVVTQGGSPRCLMSSIPPFGMASAA